MERYTEQAAPRLARGLQLIPVTMGNAFALSGHSPARPPRVKVRPATFADYPQIASLEARYGLSPKNYEEWVHLWLDNPVYRELQPGWPIGWVLEDEEKQIVGSLGNIPLRYELNGKRLLAATGRAWVVEPAYRSMGLMLLDNVITQPRVDLYLNNTVGAVALPAVTALGCPRVPAGVWDEKAYWITNYRGFFQHVAGMHNLHLTRPFRFPPSSNGVWAILDVFRCRLATPLSFPIAGLAWLRDRLRSTPLQQGEVDVRECTAFDDRFDDFWERLRSNHPHMLLAVRTRETLDWHFRNALRAGRIWIVTASGSRGMDAYAVFEKRVNPQSGLKQVRPVDYQAIDGGPSLLRALLAWTLKKCRREGMHVLEHTGQWLEPGEFFDIAAPYRFKSEVWQYFYDANNPELKAALQNPEVWAPSWYDGDATL